MKTKNDVMKDVSKKLDKKIIIQVLANSEQSENGFDEPKWIEYTPAWASVNNLYGREFWSAKAVQGEKTKEFTVRYTKKLEVILDEEGSQQYRILWGEKIFDIIFADNIKEQNEWIKIKASMKSRSN